MKPLSPLGMMALAFVLMLAGVALPLLMLLRIIPTTFALSFLAYAASFGGLILGIIGSAMYARSKRSPFGDR